jgi:hypothetical protein
MNTTVFDEVCDLLAMCTWFSPGTPVSSTYRTDSLYINWIIVESGVKHHKTNPNYCYYNVVQFSTDTD